MPELISIDFLRTIPREDYLKIALNTVQTKVIVAQ